MKALHVMMFACVIGYAGDYDFDMEAIEVKPYTLSGYLRGDTKFQGINEDSPMYFSKNKDSMKSYFGEGNIKFAYFNDTVKLDSETMLNASRVDGEKSDEATLLQLFMQYTFNQNHRVEVGKKAPKWGKGYFVNPIAFFDRKKDPNEPENSREGYVMANYRYNKSLEGDLKNLAFDLLFMKNDAHINEDFSDEEANNIGLKSYFLYCDTDIDLIYFHSDTQNDKMGFDFSKNLQTNFEIHGEFATTVGENSYAYLLGLKYLTTFDLTITSEYFYQSEQQEHSEPFYDHRYMMHQLSQKEPLDILYSSVYYKNMYNLDDRSMQNTLGVTYSFKNNMLLDLSYSYNSGKSTSEYGSKLVQDTLWAKVYWYF